MSRFRIVTSCFSIESLSTVIQNGVPISSFRAYRLPTDPVASYNTFHSCRKSLWISFAIDTSFPSFFTNGKIAALIGASLGFNFNTTFPFSFSVYASFMKTRNALSTPKEGSATTIGKIFLPVASSIISIDFPDFSWWAERS